MRTLAKAPCRAIKVRVGAVPIANIDLGAVDARNCAAERDADLVRYVDIVRPSHHGDLQFLQVLPFSSFSGRPCERRASSLSSRWDRRSQN
jgi:hypothetical protein